MNAGFDDDEFTAVDLEARRSEPNKQSNDPPPEFTGTKPSEFKSYRKKVKLWLLFTLTPAQLQGPRVLSRLTGPAWDACDGLEPEDAATADGVEAILDTLAEAFQGQHETELSDALEDTFYGPGRKKCERLRDCALRVQSNVRELAKQGVRLPDQEQEFLLLRRANLSSGSHCHHDTGGQQLVFWRSEEGVQASRRRVFARSKGTRRTRATLSLGNHRQKMQVLRQRNR